MSVQVIDNRTDFDAEENLRQRRRENIRDGLAERAMLETRKLVLNHELADLERQLAAADAAHSAACDPLQMELSRLEKAATDAIRNRRPADETNEGKRVRIIQQIEGHNRTLEAETERIRLAKKTTSVQLANLKLKIADLPRPNALLNPEVIRPDLKLKIFVNDQRQRWATQRIAAAEAQLKRRGSVATRDPGGFLERWEAELAAARAEAAAAAEESAGLVREAIDE